MPPEPGSILEGEATYVVEEGDYPFVVADRFGVDFDEFVELNGWTAEDGVVPEWPDPGTTIRIPAGATVPEGPSVLTPVPTTSPDPDASLPSGTDQTASGTSVADDGVGCGTYTIVEGDYLTRVADKLNTTVDELNAANEDTEGYSAFYVGLQINAPC
jgi:LysM repeat protein